ncbi:MAG: single-stranded DNA-binding protein [Hydrotalea sp.]|nr:single-stranded DNA-binding protein [Hydrotalea sp.]
MTTALNKVFLLGNLGADPVIRNTQKGEKVASFRIATSDRWKDQDGNMQERTEWHNIVIFGKAAEIAERFLNKGSRVMIEGQLRHRKWQDQASGQDKFITEVVVSAFNGQLHLLDGRGGTPGGGPNGGGAGGSGGGSMGGGSGGGMSGGGKKPDMDDDIPF